MTGEDSRGAPEVARPEISVAEYASFIGQIELEAIWLKEARLTNHHGPRPPLGARLTVTDDATWESLPKGFRAYHRYTVGILSDQAPLAEMEVAFGLDFSSSEPMSDRIFAVFREANLPVNTWPYLREFVGTMAARMGWLAITLPTLKRGVDGGDESPTGPRARSPRPARQLRRGRKVT